MSGPPSATDTEAGALLLEVLMAAVLLMIVLSTVFVSSTTMTAVTASSVQRGSLTGSATTGAQEVQTLLTSAWTPQDDPALGIQDECAGGGDGQSFPAGQGPFVSADGTAVWFCAIPEGWSTAWTYELHFTGCTPQGVCTLDADREPAPGVTPPPAPVGVLFVPQVLCLACVGDAGAPPPFEFLDGASGATGLVLDADAPGAPVAPSELDQIQAVTVELSLVAGSSLTTVRDDVLLPNTLAGL